MRSQWIGWIGGCAVAVAMWASSPARAQYIPDRLFMLPYSTEGIPGSTLTINGSPATLGEIPLSDPLELNETNIMATGAPVDEEGGVFERNSHLARFATDSELVTGNPNRFGHLFQRSEAWDIAFDLEIDANEAPRKEAGFFFQSQSIGADAMFIATTNDSFYGPGPGQVATVFLNVIPPYNFGGGGALGDYNQNGTVDAADYVIWRKTLGSSEDFRANGNNEGDSEDFIDGADYDVWAENFGLGGEEGIDYNVGDTLTMRMKYTPPEIDEEIPFDVGNPGANVVTPGEMEYFVSLNGGPVQTSGSLVFENAWLGLPNDTYISARVQNLSTASASPDASKVTFSNWDFNGDAPGSGLGSGSGAHTFAGVPEPTTWMLAGVGLLLASLVRRAR
jgi:PEP-CTERM motif